MVVLLTTSLTSPCRNAAEGRAKRTGVEAGAEGRAPLGRRLMCNF